MICRTIQTFLSQLYQASFWNSDPIQKTDDMICDYTKTKTQ